MNLNWHGESGPCQPEKVSPSQFRSSGSLKQVGIDCVCVGKRPVLHQDYTPNQCFPTEEATCNDGSFSSSLCRTRDLPWVLKPERKLRGTGRQKKRQKTLKQGASAPLSFHCHQCGQAPCHWALHHTSSSWVWGFFTLWSSLFTMLVGWCGSCLPSFNSVTWIHFQASGSPENISFGVALNHVLWSFSSHTDIHTSGDTRNSQCFSGSRVQTSSRGDSCPTTNCSRALASHRQLINLPPS